MKKQLPPDSFRLSKWIIALPMLFGASLSGTYGANAYWKANATDDDFTLGGNWDSGTAPGGITDSPASYTNSDVAYFNTTSTQQNILLPTVPDAQRHVVGRFIFTAGSGAYTFSGGLLRIDSVSVGGLPVAGIYMESGVTASQTFLNTLEFVGGSPYLSNNSTDPSATLNFKNIQAVNKSTGGTTNLQLQGVNTGSNTISGAISAGPGRTVHVVKSGQGTWVLSGVNVYTGGTKINGGTLIIGGAGSVNTTSSVELDGAGAVLRYDSTVGLSKNITLGSAGGTILYNSAAKYGGAALSVNSDKKAVGGSGVLGNVTVSNGGILTPGPLGENSIGTLTVDSLVLNTGASSKFDIGSSLSYDSALSKGAIQFGGTLSLSVTSLLDDETELALFQALSYTGNFDAITITGAYDGMFTKVEGFLQFMTGTGQLLTFDHQAGVLSVIPEPSSIALLGGGLLLSLGLGVVRRRPMANSQTRLS